MSNQEIIAAVLSLRSKVKRMGQDAENTHGGYNYVSIDKYYETVAKMITSEGLVWRCKEIAYEIVTGKSDKAYARATFQYDLYKGSSSMEDYARYTILSPIQGPQTTGSVVSYAEKIFMRTLGCVPTGEDDADKTAPETMVVSASIEPLPLPSAPTPPHNKDTGEIPPAISSLGEGHQEMVSSVTKDNLPVGNTKKIDSERGVRIIEEIIRTFMPDIKTTAALTDWHAMNVPAFEKVKGLDPAAHDRIKAMFNKKFSELKKEKK